MLVFVFGVNNNDVSTFYIPISSIYIFFQPAYEYVCQISYLYFYTLVWRKTRRRQYRFLIMISISPCFTCFHGVFFIYYIDKKEDWREERDVRKIYLSYFLVFPFSSSIWICQFDKGNILILPLSVRTFFMLLIELVKRVRITFFITNVFQAREVH